MNNRTVAIIQARMGSTRLPGKVMELIEGKPMIQHVIERVKACSALDDVVVATPGESGDVELRWFAREQGVKTYGSLAEQNDVLTRYFAAADHHDATTIVRITADCPLVDPKLIDQLVKCYHATSNEVDYWALDYPDGFDAEVFSMKELDLAAVYTHDCDREHVTTSMRRNCQVRWMSGWRGPILPKLSVDTQEDLDQVQQVFAALYPTNPLFGYDEVVANHRKEQAKCWTLPSH